MPGEAPEGVFALEDLVDSLDVLAGGIEIAIGIAQAEDGPAWIIGVPAVEEEVVESACDMRDEG